jgi:hypothetical protein
MQDVETNGTTRYGHSLEDFEKIRTLGLIGINQGLAPLEESICVNTKELKDIML